MSNWAFMVPVGMAISIAPKFRVNLEKKIEVVVDGPPGESYHLGKAPEAVLRDTCNRLAVSSSLLDMASGCTSMD